MPQSIAADPVNCHVRTAQVLARNDGHVLTTPHDQQRLNRVMRYLQQCYPHQGVVTAKT